MGTGPRGSARLLACLLAGSLARSLACSHARWASPPTGRPAHQRGASKELSGPAAGKVAGVCRLKSGGRPGEQKRAQSGVCRRLGRAEARQSQRAKVHLRVTPRIWRPGERASARAANLHSGRVHCSSSSSSSPTARQTGAETLASISARRKLAGGRPASSLQSNYLAALLEAN